MAANATHAADRGRWPLLLGGCALAFGVFEIFFRLVVPASNPPLVEYDPAYRLLRYTLGPQAGISTTGPAGDRPVRWRINNYGWNSAIDYAPAGKRGRPLVALIGDSYIDALQVDVGKSVADELRRRQGDRRDVYSFGFSGTPLSQYLHISRYVRTVFHPEILIFNLVYNDFDESLRDLVPLPNFLQLSVTPDAVSEVPPVPYEPSRVKRLAARSALVRYLWFNLHVSEIGTIRASRKGSPDRFYESVDLERLNSQRDRVERAVFYAVDRIRQENPEAEILFVLDAPRREIYAGIPGDGRLGWLYTLVRRACERSRCRFVDLSGPFRERYARDHVRLNFDDDYHWNAAGHALAAEVLDAALAAAPSSPGGP